MSGLLHIGASPRGAASESLRIAEQFLAIYRERNPNHEVEPGTCGTARYRLSALPPPGRR